MPTTDRFHFALSFNSAKEFDTAFERKGEDTGMFFASGREHGVGSRVIIRVTVKAAPAPIYLEGMVAWRRARSGGAGLRKGVFVALVDRERARLDGIVKFLRSAAKGKDRRSEQRYPLFAKATYATATGDFSSETRNISSGGVYLRCQGPLLSVGARFPVTLHLEGDHGRGTTISGRVAWLDLFDESKGMGVIFDPGESGIKHVQRAIKRIARDLKRLGA